MSWEGGIYCVAGQGNRWHVGCGAMGVWARHRRLARNEAQRNDVPEKPRH
jgi:hypothetical protein